MRRRRRRRRRVGGGKEGEEAHTGTAEYDNEQGLPHSGNPHDPGQSEEQDDSQYILQCGQVHPHDGAHLGRLIRRKRDTRIQHNAQCTFVLWVMCTFLFFPRFPDGTGLGATGSYWTREARSVDMRGRLRRSTCTNTSTQEDDNYII